MITLLLASVVVALADPGAPGSLRCEYLTNPLGIEAAHPRLSWVVNDPARGAMQSGYRILVASSREELDKDHGDLWDSGAVNTGDTMQVEYAGKALASAQRVVWKVKMWTPEGAQSPWSDAATWSMGLLSPKDWTAQWIGLPFKGEPASDDNNGFHSDLAADAAAPKWVMIDLGQTTKFNSVKLYPSRPIDWIRDDPGFLFPLRFRIEVSDDAGFTKPKVVVDKTGADEANPGTEVRKYSFEDAAARYVRIATTKLDSREAGKFGFTLAEMEVLSGEENVAKGKAVTASDSIERNHWSTRRLTDGVTKSVKQRYAERGPAPMLRSGLRLDAAPSRATLFITARGLYEFRINGKRVGDHELAPEWTDYSRRIQYQTYDVTPLLQTGDNALAAMLGNGWYAGRIGFLTNQMYGDQLSLLAQVRLDFPDGTSRLVGTGTDWRGTLDGPMRADDMLDGEVYDAQKEIAGWDAPGFDDSKWTTVQAFPSPTAALVTQPNEPIRVTREVKPTSITEPAPGIFIIDFGQNLPGWIKITLTGAAGTMVNFTHGEMLDDQGRLYTTNLRSAHQKDTLILSGRKDVYEPRFIYHGFRYVEVTGVTSKSDLEGIIARVAHSNSPEAGTFECSNPMLNRLEQNVRWTQYANMMSVPTDCPQRNERMGWMGDAHIFAETAIHNLDMAGFFAKWAVDIRDAQTPAGAYSDVSPNPVMGKNQFVSVPGWGDAGVAIPYRMYKNYADKRLLAEHYDSAKKWIDYIRTNNPSLIWEKARGNDYGDWLNGDTLKLEGFPSKGAEVPKEIFATACFEQSTRMVAQMATVLGKKDEAEQYMALANKIRDEFQKRFIGADAKMPGDTQAGYSFALKYDLVLDAQRPAMVGHLLNAIKARGGHLSTGFHSTTPMMDELVRAGHADVAYKLVSSTEFPSWGFMIEQGATSMWERWDGYVKGRAGGGFQDPGMNSFNHFAFGAVGEWMVRVIGGLSTTSDAPDEVAWRAFEIKPIPGEGVTWAKTTYNSIRGQINVSWRIEGERFLMDVTVPPNTWATVTMPTSNPTSVREGNRFASGAQGVTFGGPVAGGVRMKVAAGTYRFSAQK